MKRFVICAMMISIVFFSAVGVWAQSQNESTFGSSGFPGQDEGWEEMEERLSGKDFVVLGELGLISGSLLTMKGEWFIQTTEELYEIHLGDHVHREQSGIELEVDKKVVVWGFIYYDDIAVVSLAYADCAFYCLQTIEQAFPEGQLEIIVGTLVERNGTWFVRPEAGSSEIPLAETAWLDGNPGDSWSGNPVDVYRSVTSDGSLLLALSLAEGTFHFRSPEGVPLWAGQGRGQNRDLPMYRNNGTTQSNQPGLGGQNRP